MLCDAEGNFIETIDEHYLEEFPSGERIDHLVAGEVTVRREFKEGYRLRYYYKGENPGEWQWLRADNHCDEIVLCASPDEIQRNTELIYNKSSKVLNMWSLIPLKYEVKDADGNVKTTGFTKGGRYHTGKYVNNEYVKVGAEINMSNYAAGEYVVSLSCGGGRPYNITIVL